jgi:coiled-coil domain-containing protein 40
MGTLEATIYNFNKAIQQKEEECFELQRFWLRAQNEMVAMSMESNEITDVTQNLRMRLTVLNRKKMVVNDAFKSEEMESKYHTRNIRQLQNDMVKVNNLLSKQTGVFGQLEESNLELEQMFRARLKEAEVESIQMEASLEALKNEKEKGFKGLIEAE